MKARPITPARPPTLCRLSPLWQPRHTTPRPDGMGHADPTADEALRRSHLRIVHSRRQPTRTGRAA